MVDCSADVSFQCSVLRGGGVRSFYRCLFFLQRFTLLSVWGRMYVLLSPLSHSPPFLFTELVYMIHTSSQVEGIRVSSWIRSIHTKKKNIRAAFALRGHRGSCQRPVCSRTVLHVPIMYWQQGGCTKKLQQDKDFLFALSFLLMNEFNTLLPPEMTSQAFNIH